MPPHEGLRNVDCGLPISRNSFPDFLIQIFRRFFRAPSAKQMASPIIAPTMSIKTSSSRRCTRRHKRLMKFIARRKNSAENPCRDEQDRQLHLQIRSAAERPPEKHGEDRVFTDVPELADK